MTERQIAWTILQKGHDIHAADGERLGTVKEVIGDQDSDIFHGITYSPGLTQEDLFVPADRVAEITDEAVHLALTRAEADQLQPYED